MGKFEDYLFIICLFQLMYSRLVWSLFSSNFYLTYFITQMTSEEEQNFGKPSSGCGSNLVTCSTSTTDGTNLYKKRRLTSIVWNDFEVTIDGKDFSTCKHCNTKVKVGSKNETKHFHTHLIREVYQTDTC